MKAEEIGKAMTYEHFPPEMIREVVPLLTDWFKACGRILPWREGRNPYRIWISEIMLQQTRIEAVRPYYERFITRFPQVKDLAEAEEDELLKLWEGLGYYSRARNLKKAAGIVMENYGGQMPSDPAALKKLPGIGPYTAGAIASIAFRVPVPSVDGNVMRVLSRVCESREDIMKPSVRKEAEEVLNACMPEEDPGLFNEALMELGETICIPGGIPLCEKCPLRNLCSAGKHGCASELPVRAEKKTRRIEEKTVLLFRFENRTGIRKRPENGLLAGMYEFPCIEQTIAPDEAEAEIRREFPDAGIVEIRFLGTGKHIFTHVEWHMTGVEVILNSPVSGLIFAEEAELKERYALPNAFDTFRKQKKKRGKD